MLQWHISVTMLLFYSQLFLRHKVRSFALKDTCLITSPNSTAQIGLYLNCMEITRPEKFSENYQKIFPGVNHANPI